MTQKPEAESEREEALVRKARSAPDGDLRAFEQLIEQHRKRIVADCRYMTTDESIAEDLAQEVFVKAFFGLRAFEGRSSFRHWLQRIKIRHCLNHLKKREGKTVVPIHEPALEQSEYLQVPPTAHQELEEMNNHERVTRILESMAPTLRVPLIMRDMDDLSYEEIAGELGLGLSAVKMRIKRAREDFRNRYYAESGAPNEPARV